MSRRRCGIHVVIKGRILPGTVKDKCPNWSAVMKESMWCGVVMKQLGPMHAAMF